MIILGIDPGTTIVGFGVIKKERGELSALDFGVIRISTKNQSERLLEIHEELTRIIKKHKPEIAGIETLFFSANKTTGIAVAEARGVIILSLKKNGIEVKEFSPNEVKMAVTGYGKSDKKAMQKVVELNLGIKNTKLPDDAYDALAVALRASFDIH